MSRSSAIVILATLTVAACGDDGDGGGDGPPGIDASTPASFDDGVSRIEVRSTGFGTSQGGTSITALLLTAPPPWPYQPPITDGVCRMSLRNPANTCVPECDFDQICDGGTCVTFPRSGNAGTITVAGGGESEAVPFEDGYYGRYLQRGLFAEGAEVTASAPGADLPGFSLTARLPDELELLDTEKLVLAAGTPLELRWTPGGDPDTRVRVMLGADLGHGRFRSVVVECDLADRDGGVTIPQAMVDELADRENWSCGDCFSHEIRRYRRADTTVGGTTLTLWAVQLYGLYLVP